jgi:hypothetical protein
MCLITFTLQAPKREWVIKKGDNLIVMFKRFIVMLIPACIVVFCGCHQEKQSQQTAKNTQKLTRPGIIIYKTQADYFQNVPINLSTDKKTVISYPAVTDVYTNGKLALPTKLENGFLLDNRGISVNVAFIKLTYAQYAGLPATPTTAELQEMIVDSNPLTVMYDCGIRNPTMNNIEVINNLILKNDFSKFKKLN